MGAECEQRLHTRACYGRAQIFTNWNRLPGEHATQACLRHLKRELGITDVACGIEHVSTQLFVWDSRCAYLAPCRCVCVSPASCSVGREQAPKEHGTSDVSVLVNVTLPKSALAALVLEQQEYRAAQVFTLHDILTQKLAPSDAHALPPSLSKLYSDYGGFRFHPAGKTVCEEHEPCAAACCVTEPFCAVRRACCDMLSVRALRRLHAAVQEQAAESVCDCCV